jgi:type IV secretory pathway VirD2 relaxase
MEVEDEFRLRVGRGRDRSGGQVVHAAVTAGKLARRGRGQAAVRRLRVSAYGRGAELRRVIVRARIVRLKGSLGAVRAHLAYLQRDAVGPDGERGRLYDAVSDRADGKRFLDRCEGDRHQFRFIVSPEDGRDLDLHTYTRRLMEGMERDLDTALDWVAVDHTDTAYPHVHIVVRGKTQRGADLLIAQDYITEGMRLRARELATEMLGPLTAEVTIARMVGEADAVRFTGLDRRILRNARQGVIDLDAAAQPSAPALVLQAARRRVRFLEGQSLAWHLGDERWRLSDDLESQLRREGQRRDVIRSMSRALAREGEVRDLASFVIYDEDREPAIGKLIEKGLAGPTEERAAIIVDGVDGQVRRVEVSLQAVADIPIGAIVQTGQGATLADHNIDEVAEEGRIYRSEDHLHRLRARDFPVPEGVDPADIVRSHVRRLEALRRARIVERYEEGRWRLPERFLERAAAYEQKRGVLRTVSLLDLEAQIRSQGATWLDKQLVAREPEELAESGFGKQVRQALARRQAVLVERGLGMATDEGVRFRRGLLAALAQIEVEEAGQAYARARHTYFERAEPGSVVEGRYVEKLQLHSGPFAVVETRRLGYALVPWRAVIEKARGKDVTATLEPGGGVSWELGRRRERGLDLGL